MELLERRNESLLGLLRPLLSHRPEARKELGVLTGVLRDVPSNVDGTVQNRCVVPKGTFQSKTLRVAPVAHERLHCEELCDEREEPLERFDCSASKNSPPKRVGVVHRVPRKHDSDREHE